MLIFAHTWLALLTPLPLAVWLLAPARADRRGIE